MARQKFEALGTQTAECGDELILAGQDRNGNLYFCKPEEHATAMSFVSGTRIAVKASRGKTTVKAKIVALCEPHFMYGVAFDDDRDKIIPLQSLPGGFEITVVEIPLTRAGESFGGRMCRERLSFRYLRN